MTEKVQLIRIVTEKFQLLLFAGMIIGVPVAVGAGPRGEEYSFFHKYLKAPLMLLAVIVIASLVNLMIARINANQNEGPSLKK